MLSLAINLWVEITQQSTPAGTAAVELLDDDGLTFLMDDDGTTYLADD